MTTLPKKLITHNGTFHADDLFASAVLSILLDKKGETFEIIRTRDEEIIKTGDYVFDVGGIYDPAQNKFDHHQKIGAGQRENGIPYASFGLVWKTYGEQVCESKEVADIIDRNLISSIDGVDNGIDVIKPLFDGVIPSGVEGSFLHYLPTWKEDNKDIDSIFKKQSQRAVEYLLRKIEVVKADIEAKNIILDAYNKTEDKRIILINNDFPRYLYQNVLSNLSEPIYLIYPSSHSDTWKVEAVSKQNSFESRKLLPESWRGLFDGDPKLAEVTGVPDTMFCHRAGFLITVKSKEGAIKLAQIALIS